MSGTAQTRPVLDTAAVTELILDRARESGHAKVFPIGALTRRWWATILEGRSVEVSPTV